MKMPKVLSWWIQKVSGERAKLDQKIKEFLSNKIILAWILKYTVQEFFEFEITEIRDMIEGEIEISSVPLEPGSPRLLLQKGKEIITGLPSEDRVENEGVVYYDIRFFVKYPKEDKLIKMIINLEAQNEFRKYIVKRGFVYCARMISSQIRKEFSPPHYEQVKKVVSIWLCFDSPKYAKDTITSFKISQNNLYGEFPYGRLESDVMEVILVCLPEDEKGVDGIWKCKSENDLIKMLSTALSGNLSAEDKISMLESEYNMEMASEKEVNDMCNYSEYIENLGIRKGRAEGRAEGLIEGREEGREEMRAELQPEIDALKALLIANNIPLSD